MKKIKNRAPQATFHVKKNDEVVIISGAARGKRGKVLQILKQVNRVLVEGINLRKKTVRKSQEKPQGGFIEREAAMHISNVMLAADYDSRRSGAEETKSKKK